MISTENIERITKYFLFSVMILFHLCFAEDEIELNMENGEGMFRKPPRRHLLYSDYSNMNGPTFIIYIIAVVIITLISICCKYCIKQGCEPTDDYSDAVVHPPPRRRSLTVPVAPSSGRILSPPRSSRSIILPAEPGVYTVDFTGIENPNYNPLIRAPSYDSPIAPQYSTYEPSNENPTPILDLPPSYESVIREQKYPEVSPKPPK